jgi:hypothetical protein
MRDFSRLSTEMRACSFTGNHQHMAEVKGRKKKGGEEKW